MEEPPSTTSTQMDELQVDSENQLKTSAAHSKWTKQSILKLFTGFFRKKKTIEKTSESVLQELLQPTRYKPNDLEQISLETKFTKNEVKFLYRAFKTECPNGIIDEETFKEVYEKIFPMGDASKYAQIVFRAIDRNRTGGITFGDFMQFLSVITKGTDYEKILWSFQFFDINQDGKITRDEMIKVSESVYELIKPMY
ncbi:calsenilin isoform X2 [Eurytemora carolleeae]|uniref:calsenilin isoform X2 n=1 Tax=Eurytemora carolleeae TaxID=1294199 RepID=UPI000C75620A|nr:calsenilin isoform X2 [Eurytemora carolleeae]|eukprot:XP_023325415.1 calsenilin-like isoform X2 [Eurytemora affinis]